MRRFLRSRWTRGSLLALVCGGVAASCGSAEELASRSREGAAARVLQAVGQCGDGAPILVLRDSVRTANNKSVFQNFVPELLKTEGYTEYAEAELSAVTESCLSTHKVVILPALKLTSTDEGFLANYASSGGFLIAFRPKVSAGSTFLPSVFGVSTNGGHICGYVGPLPTAALCAGGQTIAPPSQTVTECTSGDLPDGDVANRTGMECSFCTTASQSVVAEHPVAQGLEALPITVHSAVRRLSLGSGAVAIATIRDPLTLTPYPSVTHRALPNGGQAALFSYDVAESVALTKQGNPWHAGPHDTAAYNTEFHDADSLLASGGDKGAQFFSNVHTGLNWNNQWRSELPGSPTLDFLNETPQADEHSRLLSNLIRWGLANNIPIPRLWYYPTAKPNVVTYSSDGCGVTELKPPAVDADSDMLFQKQFQELSERGAAASAYTWPQGNPVTYLSLYGTTATNLAANPLQEVGIHYNVPWPHATWDEMLYGLPNDAGGRVAGTGVHLQRDLFAQTYPSIDATRPRTTRMHAGRWTSTGPQDELYPAGQARILATGFSGEPRPPDVLDSSYISFPRSYGYMNGAAVPSRVVDVCATSPQDSILNIFEHNTSFEDDILLSQLNFYGTKWSTIATSSRAASLIHRGFTSSNTALNPLFHAINWRDHLTINGVIYPGYRPAGLFIVDFAAALGVPVMSPRTFAEHWTARERTRLSNVAFNGSTLSFTLSDIRQSQTLLLPLSTGDKVLSAFTLDGTTAQFSVEQFQGGIYATVMVGPGLPAQAYVRTASATYAPANRASGTVPSITAATTKIVITGKPTAAGLPEINLSVNPNADGTFALPPLWTGAYQVRPISHSSEFLPAQAQVTLGSPAALTFATSSNSGAAEHATSLFAADSPAREWLDAPLADKEYGTQFYADAPGVITHLRFWRSSGDTSAHVGSIWQAGFGTGNLLARVTLPSTGGADGWQEQRLPAPIPVVAGVGYIVSVNSGPSKPQRIWRGLDNKIYRKGLLYTTSLSGSVAFSGASAGSYPATALPGNDNLLRDVVFVPRSQSLRTTSTAPAATIQGGVHYMLGTRFRSSVEGQVNQLQFYRTSGDLTTHYGMLWRATDGAVLAQVSMPPKDSTAPGRWEATDLGSPVRIDSNVDYIVGVNAAPGSLVYPYTYNAFTSTTQNGYLTIPGGSLNGLYSTFIAANPGTTPMPFSSYLSSNYFRDVTFTRSQSVMRNLPIFGTGAQTFNDAPYELGTRFKADVNGRITSIRFYKTTNGFGQAEAGPHVGKIWSTQGKLLATAVFTDSLQSGWVEAPLSSPLPIQAETEYTVSVNTGLDPLFGSDGGDELHAAQRRWMYLAHPNGLAAGISFRHLRTYPGGGRYGSMGGFPTQTLNNNNYFRDVVFLPD